VLACVQVKAEEWDAIPDIGDYTIKKRKTMQSFVPVPDTLLSKARPATVQQWLLCGGCGGKANNRVTLAAVGHKGMGCHAPLCVCVCARSCACACAHICM